MSFPVDPEVRKHLIFIQKWCQKGIGELWNRCLTDAKKRWKSKSTSEKHALILLLNDLLNEGDVRINNTYDRMRRFKDHIRDTLNQSRASYEQILSKEELSVDDVALMEAIGNENYHDIFVGSPTSKDNKEEFYKQAGARVNAMLDKYHIQALTSMKQLRQEIDQHPEDAWAYDKAVNKWQTDNIQQQIDQHIVDVVPNREAYKEAHKATDVAEFLSEIHAKEDDEYLQQLIDGFITTHTISFENLSNNARRKLQPMLQQAIKTIAEGVDQAGAVIYVKGYAGGKWRTVKSLTPEEFELWMTNMFVNPDGQFIVKYDDNYHYVLSDGDTMESVQIEAAMRAIAEEEIAKKAAALQREKDKLPAYIFERLHLDIATGKHKDGGNFCKYYYNGDDEAIKKWIRERYQIADHVPNKNDTDLMVPCAIHSILTGIETYKHKPLTARQQATLKDYLYTRIKTRYINASSLAIIAEEIGMQIEICDINGTPTHKYTVHGNKYSKWNPEARYCWDQCDKDHKKEGILFGTTDKTITSQHYKYLVKLVLWDDHFFVNEMTPFGKTSYNLIKDLIDENKLTPLNIMQKNVYPTQLPEYKCEIINWEESMFKTPMQVYEYLHTLHPVQPYRCFDSTILDITRDNLGEKIDGLENKVLPQLGYQLFLEEVMKLNVNIVADSSIPKNFIHQSIKGPRFAISRGQIVGATTILDRNSNHSYALSQIDLPIGRPHTSTSDDILTKPIFVVDADVEYKPQHELDHGFRGRCVINNIDAKAVGLKINHVYKGYWWSEVAKQPLKPLMELLYSLRQSHPKIKRVMNSMYGKLIEHAPATVMRNTEFTDEIRTHALIKEYEEKEGQTTYIYYNDTDFQYNFTMVASLLLAQQRANMREVFTYCNKNNIPMYYSAADSIAIPTDKLTLMKQFMGNKLGQFKIEAQGDEAVFVKAGLYICGDKIVTSLPHKTAEDIKAYCNELNINVIDMYKNIVKGQIYSFTYPSGIQRCLHN